MDTKSDDWLLKPRLLGVVVGGGPILKVSTVIQPTGDGVGLFATLMLGCSGFKGPFRALTISLES